MVYGLNSATGKYFCIWCPCTKAKICDFSSKLYGQTYNNALELFFCFFSYLVNCHAKIVFKLLLVQDWPIERTLEQCERNCSGKTTDSRKGSIHKPLLSIPFDQVIINTASFSEDYATTLPSGKYAFYTKEYNHSLFMWFI